MGRNQGPALPIDSPYDIFSLTDKGKPVETQGRKATGLNYLRAVSVMADANLPVRKPGQ